MDLKKNIIRSDDNFITQSQKTTTRHRHVLMNTPDPLKSFDDYIPRHIFMDKSFLSSSTKIGYETEDERKETKHKKQQKLKLQCHLAECNNYLLHINKKVWKEIKN